MSQIATHANVEIGTLLTDADGYLYVVTSKEEHDYYLIAELSEVTAGMEHGQAWEADNADNWPPDSLTHAGTASEEIMAYITAHTRYQAGLAQVWADVDPADHRRLYNALHYASHWDVELDRAQARVSECSKQRSNELRKVVDIVGTQDRAAKLLGMNQSTLSRALRDRD